MNIFGTIILVTLLVGYLLDLIGDILNLGTLKQPLPPEFEGVYDREKYAHAQEYTRTRTRFSLFSRSFDLAVLLGFWFGGGFAWLDRFTREFDWAPVPTGLAFFALLLIAQTLLGIPFAAYSAFGIETRFGFNRMTWSTFWIDRLKGLLVGAILLAPLLAALLWILGALGSGAWIAGWGLTVAFLLVAQVIVPIWILPLFNRFEALEEGELLEKILTYAAKVNFPLTRIFSVDGSRRSNKSNAFFTGFGKTKRLALYDTLIEQQTPDELVAVVAHEVGHHRHGHIFKGLAISILHTGVLFFLLGQVIDDPELFRAFGLEETSLHAGLVFASLLLTPLNLILSIGTQGLSRIHEFQADRFAARTADPEAMVSALMKLARDNLVHLTPHPFIVFLHHSHPPILQRIRAIRGVASPGAAAP